MSKIGRVLILANTLFWAGAILASAWFFPETKILGLEPMFFIFVPFIASNGLLTKAFGRTRCC